jgi:hypothetical protein
MDAATDGSQAAASTTLSPNAAQFVAGVLARFVFTPESAADAPAFFEAGLPIVQTQPESTIWLAFRVNETTFGAFAAFASEDDRAALLAAGGPKLAGEREVLFAEAPTFDKVDILASRVVAHRSP